MCIHSYINVIGRTCAYMIYSYIPGEAVPAVGFGFGDAVIVEMLKSKELLPDTTTHTASVVVYALTESLRAEACGAVEDLRAQGTDGSYTFL